MRKSIRRSRHRSKKSRPKLKRRGSVSRKSPKRSPRKSPKRSLKRSPRRYRKSKSHTRKRNRSPGRSVKVEISDPVTMGFTKKSLKIDINIILDKLEEETKKINSSDDYSRYILNNGKMCYICMRTVDFYKKIIMYDGRVSRHSGKTLGYVPKTICIPDLFMLKFRRKIYKKYDGKLHNDKFYRLEDYKDLVAREVSDFTRENYEGDSHEDALFTNVMREYM
jgi:hypothetical protein